MEPVERMFRSLDAALEGGVGPRFDLLALDPTDACVAKLARLHGDDREDIEAMVERGVVTHERLLARFRSAVIQHGGQGMGHKLRGAIDNLHRVERDLFLEVESEIEIPDWMDA